MILDQKNKIGEYKTISCTEAQRILQLIADDKKDQITAQEQAAVMLHVAECETCEVPISSADSSE